MSSITMTTPSAANSNVPSRPLNASAESAALPAGPVMCTASPASPAAIDRIFFVTFGALFQPLWPKSTGMTTCAACPSREQAGPPMWPTMVRVTALLTTRSPCDDSTTGSMMYDVRNQDFSSPARFSSHCDGSHSDGDVHDQPVRRGGVPRADRHRLLGVDAADAVALHT